MNQRPYIAVLLVLIVCTAQTLSCATPRGIVTTELVPPGTPQGEPQAGAYDRVNISCDPYPMPVFRGRVVRRAHDGELVPVLGVTVLLETHGTVHATPTPTRITIAQNDDGRFAYRLELWSDTLVYYKGGVAVAWQDIDDTATLTVQAAGCEPARVEYENAAVEQTIELQCGDNGNPL